AAHWEEFTLAGEALTETVVYILNIQANEDDAEKGTDYQIAYDTPGGAVDSYIEQGTYATPESPWTEPPDITTADYSIYLNYPFVPAGWTGKISGVTNPAKIMGVPVANIAKVKGVA
ncbi:unnamed protein product, partial [marine sediment metagenome]